LVRYRADRSLIDPDSRPSSLANPDEPPGTWPGRVAWAADALLAGMAAALPPGSLRRVLSGQGNTALWRVLHGECLDKKERGMALLLAKP